MKVPLLEELKIKAADQLTPDVLIKYLSDKNIGQNPYYIDLGYLAANHLENFLALFEEVLEHLHVSPVFPYPIYIISPHIDLDTNFSIFKKYEEIPIYFKHESARVTLKEQKVLEKIDITKSHIGNENINDRLYEFKESMYPQKLVKSLSKEGFFLEKIVEKIRKENRMKQRAK